MRSVERTKPNENMLRKISSSQLPIPPQALSTFVKTYTPYALNNFYEKSIEQATNYVVTSARVADLVGDEIDKFQPRYFQSTERSFVSHQRSDLAGEGQGSTQRRRERSEAEWTTGIDQTRSTRQQGIRKVVFIVSWAGVVNQSTQVPFADRRGRGRYRRTSSRGRESLARGSGRAIPSLPVRRCS